MDIKLNFINRSNDDNNSSILIFQKNAAASVGEIAVAWLVITNCGQGDNHPFVYPMSMAVGAKDSFGNYTPQLAASYGQKFAMTLTKSGDQLSLVGHTASPQEIEIENGLSSGAIDAMVFKAGHLFASKTDVAPGQLAVFHFEPRIWIGVASEVEQGQIINEAIMSDINTEITLLGIASADIVMTGGGSGPEARPFEFNLENVVYA
jgi:hypothetical protein